MNASLQRYVALFGSLILVALVAIPLVWALISNRGVAGPTIPEAISPAWGLTVLVFGVGFMTLVACVVGRVINAAVALFVLGCGIGVIAMRSGNVADFAWEDGSLWALGAETLIWGVVVVVLTTIVFKVTGGLPDVQRDWNSAPVGSIAALGSRESLTSLACAIVALPVVWFLMGNDLKGQALGAVFLGSVLAGLVGRVFVPRIDPILLFGGPVLFGGIAQLVHATGSPVPLANELVEGTLPRLTWVMPIDWAAGSLTGVSFGLGLARNFVLDGSKEGEMHSE